MTDTQPPSPRRVHAIAGWRRLLLWPLGLVVRLWCRTLRFELDATTRAALSREAGPTVFTLWHNRLFVTAEIFRRFRNGKRIFALVSASKDGAWLAAFFAVVGMHTVRGSSSRFGREALHALAEKLQQGDDIGITPDGPRGPCYDLKGGGVILARKTGATTVLFGIRFTRAWQLPSWDRFYLPWPFSRIVLRAEEWTAERLADEANVLEVVRARLLALNPD
ncbi:MAG: lysophospholipid acyltransferase family protein [Opitutaceae bacterium]